MTKQEGREKSIWIVSRSLGFLRVEDDLLTYVVAILLIQDCLERLFLSRWMCVVYIGRQRGVHKIALWLRAILLANVEHHSGLK